MTDIVALAEANQRKAREVIAKLRVVEAWEAVGAEAHLVGSLRTGLLMKHRDIDFHIYSSPFRLSDSFAAMAALVADPAVKRFEGANLLHTPEACVEWHLWYDDGGEEWQVDMIHLVKGSRYDGYFERVAERIEAVITPRQRETVLRLKYETPDDEKIMGIEYYLAVIRDGIADYPAFVQWRKQQPADRIIEWIPSPGLFVRWEQRGNNRGRMSSRRKGYPFAPNY